MTIQLLLFFAMPMILTALRSIRVHNNIRIRSLKGETLSASVIENVEIAENKALDQLQKMGIICTTYKHEAVFTVEAQTDEVANIPGSQTKNLFLKDKKHGLFLITAMADRSINLKSFGRDILKLTPKPNFSFGKPELLEETLGVSQGSVTPLAMMNDKEKKVTFLIDKALVNSDLINCHPLRNDRTTSIKPADLISFIESYGHNVAIIDFDIDKDTI